MHNVYFPGEKGRAKLDAMFAGIRKAGKDKQYDCMMGISGGLDSSYVVYLAHVYGLRVLMLHVDDGFDAPVSTANINKISRAFNYDLIIEKPAMDQYLDLTRAFILAGVPDIAIPQDSVLLATLYKTAVKHGIQYFLSGYNFSLESITQSGMDATDKVHILDIHKKFGRVPLDGKLPLFSILDRRIRYRYLHNVRSLKPLYYVDYNAWKALDDLKNACGFEYYGSKHCESIFTKFVQVYYLPEKFGIDKRTSHYSSMIVSGQMTREEALHKLSEPMYDNQEMEKDLEYILDKLELTRDEFERVMNEKPMEHSCYKTSLVNSIAGFILQTRRRFIGY
jgi:N-acetyl sugar amidotransferase